MYTKKGLRTERENLQKTLILLPTEEELLLLTETKQTEVSTEQRLNRAGSSGATAVPLLWCQHTGTA